MPPAITEDYELWPDNALAFSLLSGAQWQWLSGMTVARVGIDQGPLWMAIDRHPGAPEGKPERWALFEDVIAAGEACCEVWRGP